MSIIPKSVLKAKADQFFTGVTFKVALYKQTGSPLTADSTYTDIQPYLIADGVAGYTWQDLVYLTTEIIWDGFAYTLPSKKLTFGRDTTNTTLQYDGVAILRPLVGGPPNYELVAWQQLISPRTVRPGSAALININGGYGV